MAQRLRLRGTKKASKDTQARLGRNLEILATSPASTLPEYPPKYRQNRGRQDPVQKTLKSVQKVFDHRKDRKWLMKNATGTRRDTVAKAYAGALVAALDEDQVTVATFKHALYGAASYIRRGDARPMQMVGVQQHSHPRLRLLAWEDHSRKGYHFWSWKGGFICTGKTVEPPLEWLEAVLENAPVDFTRHGDLWAGKGLTPDAIDEQVHHLRLDLPHGQQVCLAPGQMGSAKMPLVVHLALQALPPRPSDYITPHFVWTPDGWPEDTPLPAAAQAAADEVLESWLALTAGIEEPNLWAAAVDAALDGLDTGRMVGDRWFADDDVGGFLAALTGSAIEREAAEHVLELIDEGLHVTASGEAEWGGDVLRLEDPSIHTFLVGVWEQCGETLLESLFGLDRDEAERLAAQQAERPKAMGAWLRRIDADRAKAATFARFPWAEGSLPGACGLADELVRLAHAQGKGRAVSRAAGLNDGMTQAALGWAWLSALGKESGKAWHFEQAARDLGDGWTTAVRAVWEASQGLVQTKDAPELDDEGGARYVTAIRELHAITGSLETLPEPR